MNRGNFDSNEADRVGSTEGDVARTIVELFILKSKLLSFEGHCCGASETGREVISLDSAGYRYISQGAETCN